MKSNLTLLNEFLKRHRLLIVLQTILLGVSSLADEQFFGGVIVGVPLGWGLLFLLNSFFELKDEQPKEDA